MYKYIIFDLDGTLLNTSLGIYNSFKYTFLNMKMPFPGMNFVQNTIGIPLKNVFEEQLGFDKNTCKEAILLFRSYYERYGKLEMYSYTGIQETLRLLTHKKCLLGIATLKKELFAKEMIQFQKWSHFFVTIHGMDDDFEESKTSLIQKCMLDLKALKKDTIMVGDGISDFLGAKEAGIDFMGVTYGFGFREDNIDDLTKGNILYVAHTGTEIGKIITSKPIKI